MIMTDDVIFNEPPNAHAPDTHENVNLPEDAMTSFERRLIDVQRKLKAPKSQFNSFGGYHYRSCEDILEGLKPLLEEYNLLMIISDEIVCIEGRFYVKATVTVTDIVTGVSKQVSAYAREPENRKGSDPSQATGSSSSYARKYALNGFWLIDDTKDADFGDSKNQKQRKPKEPPAQGAFLAQCANCGTQYQFTDRDYYISWSKNPNPPCCSNPQWMVL